MTCRRSPDDHDQILIRGQHADPTPDDHDGHCRGCAPCPTPTDRHCRVCTRHLTPTELRTCVDCVGAVRRDLVAILELAALIPGHALHAARDGRLIGSRELPGDEALNMLARGSEGLSDTADTTRADEPSPPSFVLGWWEEAWRAHLGLDSRRPPWQRRPAVTLVDAYRFLDHHHTWAAQHHPGFYRYARDLRQLRRHLEELLAAGDDPAHGVPCFECDTTLVRDYLPPAACSCGPKPRPRHRHHGDQGSPLCCLGCATIIRWELTHETHDQGGLVDPDPNAGWYCPRCGRDYSPGEYQRAVSTDYELIADRLPATELAERLGVEPATIWKWAERGHVRRRGRASDRRTLYDVADATRQATRHEDVG